MELLVLLMNPAIQLLNVLIVGKDLTSTFLKANACHAIVLATVFNAVVSPKQSALCAVMATS
jgi:hypothetical protein